MTKGVVVTENYSLTDKDILEGKQLIINILNANTIYNNNFNLNIKESNRGYQTKLNMLRDNNFIRSILIYYKLENSIVSQNRLYTYIKLNQDFTFVINENMSSLFITKNNELNCIYSNTKEFLGEYILKFQSQLDGNKYKEFLNFFIGIYNINKYLKEFDNIIK